MIVAIHGYELVNNQIIRFHIDCPQCVIIYVNKILYIQYKVSRNKNIQFEYNYYVLYRIKNSVPCRKFCDQKKRDKCGKQEEQIIVVRGMENWRQGGVVFSRPSQLIA